MVNLVDEGVDVAVRIAFMPDSALVATKLGVARRVVCASPAYLAQRGTPRDPSELADHGCVLFTSVTPTDTWTFGGSKGQARRVRVRPTLTVNTADAAVGSAVDGHGITAVLSYQVAREIEDGRLVRVLASFEPEPVPVHLVQPAASASVARVRAFVELAAPRLRAALASAERAGIASGAAPKATPRRPAAG